MSQCELSWAARRLALVSVLALYGASFIPSDARIALQSERSLSVAGDGVTLSTTTICPGYAFVQIGPGEPVLSPDLHWVLVDVLGPFEPGNVPRTHALVQVSDGAIVLAPNFPEYFGVPTSLQALAWASGERAVLRYSDGTTERIRDTPLKPIPTLHCAAQPAL